MSTPRTRSRCAPILLVLAVLSVPARASSADQPASHHRMLERLENVRASAKDRDFYLGDLKARQLRAQLASLPAGASNDPKRLQILIPLGLAELAIGNADASIARLEEAYAILPAARKRGLPAKSAHAVLFALGMAYLRLGETENCCLMHSPESCIVPIAGGGIHKKVRGSKGAMRFFQEALAVAEPGSNEDLQARWLLNIAAMTLGQYPAGVPAEYRIPESAFRADPSFPRFPNVAHQLGLDTVSLAGGAVCDDIDNDNYLDLLVSNWDVAGQIRYFHNDGNGSFSDRTAAAGLTGIFGGLNLVQADYNNDGFVDVLVLRGAWLFDAGQIPNSLLRNNGDGTFSDVSYDAGLAGAGLDFPTQTASWADYDNDGDLDLYVGNESTEKLAAPNQLFRNNGDETFTDVAAAAGVTNLRFTKGVIWGDYDSDRAPDLYVSNLSGPNRLYHNNGNGTFTDVAVALGVEKPIVSFPTWFWDVDNDGILDLFVSAYATKIEHLAGAMLGMPVDPERLARLYLGNGAGGFEEVGQAWGLRMPNSPMGSNFGDLDNDGYLDFYLGTGDPDVRNIMPNVMFRNREGRGFVDVTMAGGFGHLQKGHGVVFADLDHDGDQDVFEEMGGAYPVDKFSDVLYENPGFERHWLAIRVSGRKSNRSAIGARVHVAFEDGGTSRSVYRWINSGGSFGGNPLRCHVGLGKARRIDRIEIFWPSTGETQTLTGVPLDRIIAVVEGQPGYETVDAPGFRFRGSNP
jgi:hypothetical protein